MANEKITGNEKVNPSITTVRNDSTLNGKTYVYGDVSSKGGLTIRQHFAIMALQGICSMPTSNVSVSSLISSDVANAVKYADALIVELNK